MAKYEPYPRPDFERKCNWSSLNGLWDFIFDDASCGLLEKWHEAGLPMQAGNHSKREIKVPYAFQTPASGINLQEAHEVIWYERVIDDIRSDEERAKGYNLLLRFGAVDFESTIWLDGRLVETHVGGQVGFDVDVSSAFNELGKKSARLTLRVRDSPTDLTQPRGKQYWGPIPESIFYTPTSGIWQSVWLESVPMMRVGYSDHGTVVRAVDDVKGKAQVQVVVVGRPTQAKCHVEVQTKLGRHFLQPVSGDILPGKDMIEFELDMRLGKADMEDGDRPFADVEGAWNNSIGLWAPEHPILYDLIIRVFDYQQDVVDEVHTTTGVRSLSWETGDGTFRINSKPYFQALVLDQGYWPDTGMTPPSQEALRADIEMSKRMGFNGCRKHQKVEDPVFLYWANRLGYLVWGEIGNAYEFKDEYINRFESDWVQVVKRDINHPSLITWTPVNESWGYNSLKDNIDQRNHIRRIYLVTKAMDYTRPINDNCGWEHVKTDLTTYHDYSDSAQLAEACSRMQGGILARKSHGDMFVKPLYSGSTVLDPGAAHKSGAPVICSEFGGVNIAPAKDSQASSRDWGYTTAADPKDLLARLEKLIMAVVKGGHSCGFVYTQLTDIEQEVNGLYSYDRREKVPAEKVKAIMDAAKDYYYKMVLPFHVKH